jgi:hypothetical protein
LVKDSDEGDNEIQAEDSDQDDTEPTVKPIFLFLTVTVKTTWAAKMMFLSHHL